MKKNPNQTIVGLFVIIGFILLTVVIFFISGVYVFRPGYSVFVMYDYVSILDKGAPVRMAGVRVGEVNQVNLMYDKETQHTRVRIKLFIEKGVDIGDNYQFKIQGTHVLSEPHIEITPKPGSANLLTNGSEVQGAGLIPIETLIQNAHDISENLNAIIRDIRDVMEGSGNKENLTKMIGNLTSISESLKIALGGSEGDVSQAVKNLKNASDSLEQLLAKANSGESTVGKLMTSDELYQDVRDLIRDIKLHPWRLLKKDKNEKADKKVLGIF